MKAVVSTQTHVQTLKDLQESHHVCRLIESGSARCRDDKDRLFIAMQVSLAARSVSLELRPYDRRLMLCHSSAGC
jgi:hypothetical protein